jgi:hypothetical protein
LVIDENGDLPADSQILNRWKNFSSDAKQTEIPVHKAEPLVPQPSPFEDETAFAKLKK